LKIRLLASAIILVWPASVVHAQDQSTEQPPATTNQPEAPSTETPTTEANTPATAAPEGEESSIETVRTETGDIVVTARRYVPSGSITANKTNIPLIETPQSISVITRDQMDLLSFVDAQQAVRYTAGTTGENYGPDLRFDFITVRGFTPRQFIDGLATPVTTTIFSTGVDLYAFESFDILKGPASVLYGSSPPGGLYNQISRRASSRFGGEVHAKYGEDDYKQMAGTVTGPLSEIFDARVTFLYRDRDAQRDFVRADRLLLAPTGTLKLGDRTRLTGLFYFQRDDVRGDTNGFLPAAGTLLPNPLGKVSRSVNLGEPDYNRYVRKQWGIGLAADHRLTEELTLSSNVKWSNYRERSVVIFPSFLAADNRTVIRSSFPYNEDVRNFGIDTRVSGDFETGTIGHKLLIGVDYRNVFNDARFTFAFGAAPSIDLFDPEYGVGAPYITPGLTTRFNEQRLKQTGIYAQDQLQFGNLYLMIGGRYDWVKTRYIAPFTSLSVDGPVVTEKQDAFTYRLGANYVFDNGFAPYLSYSTSFEPVLGADPDGDAFDPSTGRQIEAGLKFDGRALGPDFRVFGTAAMFHILQKNLVTSQNGPLPVGGTQSGEVEAYGGELEVVARIREQLSINGSYSYTRSEVTESQAAIEIGADLPTTPRHKASLFVDYTLPRGPLAGLGFGVGGRYTSKSAGALPSGFEPVVYYAPAVTLFDAIVHYDLPGWRFAVNGSNIFDKRYVGRCAGTFNCNFGAGRQIIATATKRF
jgi:iron complex outermembrane receptor protein